MKVDMFVINSWVSFIFAICFACVVIVVNRKKEGKPHQIQI